MKKISKKRQQPTRPRLFQVSLALLGIIFILISCDSCRKPKVDPVDPPDPPVASTLKIDSFKVAVGSITTSGADFNFSTTSNKTITIQSLIDTVNSKTYDVLGKTTFSVNNLLAGQKYPFTLYAKDASGKEVKQSLTLTTEAKKSSWLKSVELVYNNPFQMDRNIQSEPVSIKIVSTASAEKTLPALTINFGENGEAVKMLRYRQQDTATWTINKTSGETVTLKDLKLKPGLNVIPAYFAIKSDLTGTNISNGANLTMSVASIDDGDGATVPTDGLGATIPAGSVNTVDQPTIVLGVKYQAIYGSSYLPSQWGVDIPIATITFTFSGPAGSEVKSMRLYNPYYQFQGLVYSSFRVSHVHNTGNYYENFNNLAWESGQKFVTLDFTNMVQNDLDLYYSNYNNYNEFGFWVHIDNRSGRDFNSDNYTPGEYEFYLLSPFDLSIIDKNGKTIDMSELTVGKKT